MADWIDERLHSVGFVGDGRLVKTDNGPGYVFDNPFVRGWAVLHALPDMGHTLPWTFRASQTSEYQG